LRGALSYLCLGLAAALLTRVSQVRRSGMAPRRFQLEQQEDTCREE